MIRKLAEPCRMSDLKHGDFVWLDGHHREVLAINPELGVCLRDQTGGQEWVDFQGRDVTRCGPQGEMISVSPFDPKWCGPNSLDCHLGETLKVYDLPGEVKDGRWVTHGVLDPENPPGTLEYRPEADGRWLLWPGRGYLGSVVERIESHYLVPDIDGRSSTGRYFVTLHQTAGRGDDAWGGHFTCEIVVTQPTLIRPGSRAAQIRWTRLWGERKKYSGRYQNQPAVPVESLFHV
jgi:dCTP deaminase